MLWLLLLEVMVLFVLGGLGLQLALLLHTRRRNERFCTTQKRLDDATQNSVKELQVVSEDYKANRADGRLTKEKARDLRATAIKTVIDQLGPLGMREVRKTLGMPPKSSLDYVLGTRIEAVVFDLKIFPKASDKIPRKPGERFYPDTMRIARIEKTPVEEHPESLFDEPTETQRRPR